MRRALLRPRWLPLLAACVFYWPGVASSDEQFETLVDVATLDRFMEQHLEKTGIPGMSIAVTRDSSTVLMKGYGRDGFGAVMTERTPMLIGSLSKAFTALAIMQLVENDRIELDLPVTTYLPEFKLKDSRYSLITVRQLLNHTSGMADRTFFEWSRPGPLLLRDAVAKLRTAKLAADPGHEFNYHNPNYAVAARIVEVVSDKVFSQYLRERVFDPLRMYDSFAVNRLDQADDRVPPGHVFIFGKPIPLENPSFFLGGSGDVISTAADMMKWLHFLERGGVSEDGARLVSEASIKEMFRASSSGSAYGLGWIDASAESPPRAYHLGIMPTFTAFQSVSLNGGSSLVVLSNGSRTFVRGSSASYIQFAIPALEQGAQPESFGVSSREVDIPLLILTTLVTLAAAIHSRRLWGRASSTRATRLVAALIWGALLISILSVPSIVFQFMGGRAAAWDIWLESSSWLWLFYVSPMSVVFCAVAAVCAIMIMVIALYRSYKLDLSCEISDSAEAV